MPRFAYQQNPSQKIRCGNLFHVANLTKGQKELLFLSKQQTNKAFDITFLVLFRFTLSEVNALLLHHLLLLLLFLFAVPRDLEPPEGLERGAALAHPQSGQPPVEALQHDAGLADLHGGDVAAAGTDSALGKAIAGGVGHAHLLARVDDVLRGERNSTSSI